MIQMGSTTFGSLTAAKVNVSQTSYQRTQGLKVVAGESNGNKNDTLYNNMYIKQQLHNNQQRQQAEHYSARNKYHNYKKKYKTTSIFTIRRIELVCTSLNSSGLVMSGLNRGRFWLSACGRPCGGRCVCIRERGPGRAQGLALQLSSRPRRGRASRLHRERVSLPCRAPAFLLSVGRPEARMTPISGQ